MGVDLRSDAVEVCTVVRLPMFCDNRVDLMMDNHSDAFIYLLNDLSAI